MTTVELGAPEVERLTRRGLRLAQFTVAGVLRVTGRVKNGMPLSDNWPIL